MRDNCRVFYFYQLGRSGPARTLTVTSVLSLNCEPLLLIMKTKTDVNAVNCFLNKEFKRIKENNISLEEEK